VQLAGDSDDEGFVVGEKRRKNGEQEQQNYEAQPAKREPAFGELVPDHFAV
jgi:hypothetical protein